MCRSPGSVIRVIVRVATLHVVLPTVAPIVQGVDVAPALILQHPDLVISEKGLLEAGKPIESLLASGSLADFLLLALRAQSMLAVVSVLLYGSGTGEAAVEGESEPTVTAQEVAALFEVVIPKCAPVLAREYLFL